MEITCPKCNKNEIFVVSKETKLSLAYYLVDEWSIIDEESLEETPLIACKTCGWFDTVSGRDWKEWDVAMKEFLNGDKQPEDPFKKWRVWNEGKEVI
jgi:DNA-directed RNA polymerase subunit RPC12/RpoP